MTKLENVVLLYDADIFAYRASSATDGRQYVVTWLVDGSGILQKVCTEKLKYKKDALLRAAETGGSWELIYDPEPESHAFHIVKTLVDQVPRDLGSRVSIVGSEHYLTAKGSFREKLVPSYKENRKELRRPKHLVACKEFITKKYDTYCHPGEYEADDLLAIRMTYWQAKGFNPICVSVDKDLKQVPGWHWDFVSVELVLIDEVTGHRNFYKQLLTGDTTDGIIGIKGIGPKTAEKLIDHLSSPFEMYVVCLKEWLKFLKQEPKEEDMAYMMRVVNHVKLNARLLYLLRNYDEHWTEPEEPHEE